MAVKPSKTSARTRKRRRTTKSTGLTYLQDPIVNVLADLDVVASRLRRSDHFAARLAAERIDLTPEKYFARLKKRKAELIKEAGRLEKRAFDTMRGDFQTFAFVQRYSAKQGSTYEHFSFRNGKILLPESFSLIARTALTKFELSPTVCGMPEDVVPPSATRVANVSGSSINHGSTTSFFLDETFLNSFGVTFGRASLDDDAAWWRDDNPDRFNTGYELNWKLPPPRCHMWVTCHIDASQRIEFTNGADDGGGCRTSIMLANSNEEGHFVPVSLNNETVIFDSSASASLTSARFSFLKTFPILQGREAQVALGHFVKLHAQDGKVEALCTFRTNERFTDSGPPNLWFMMIPQ